MIARYGRPRSSRSLVERLFTDGVCNAACGSTRISPDRVDAPIVPRLLGFQRSVANAAFGTKQKFCGSVPMSAFGGKADSGFVGVTSACDNLPRVDAAKKSFWYSEA